MQPQCEASNKFCPVGQLKKKGVFTMATINFTANNQGGFSGPVEAREDVVLAEFLAAQGVTNFGNAQIRVNGVRITAEQLGEALEDGDNVEASVETVRLHDGDQVLVTPTKVKGA
jgi:hypothetical protein